MSGWGFWEWLTYSCIGIAAVVLAADQAIKGSAEMSATFQALIRAQAWSYAPLAFIAASAILILAHQFGWLGTTVKNAEESGSKVEFIDTKLRLQFFGDIRIPHEISSDNVVSWFAYYTQSVEVSPQDEKGNVLPGGLKVPPSWIIVVVFDKPTAYRQAITTFSNPELAPPTQVRQATTRSMVITTASLLPAGVLEIAAHK